MLSVLKNKSTFSYVQWLKKHIDCAAKDKFREDWNFSYFLPLQGSNLFNSKCYLSVKLVEENYMCCTNSISLVKRLRSALFVEAFECFTIVGIGGCPVRLPKT